MMWKKLGRIFDPTQHAALTGPLEFAQSPQALVIDDFVRIYFSTRQRDGTGKFLSQIAYIDIDKDFKKIRALSSHSIIELGGLGTFDEHGIFPINILKNGDEVFAYTCGWTRRVSVSVETSIGLAISHDQGRTFTKHGDGPILTSSLHEPFLVGDPFVRIYGQTFHMWYIFGTKWFASGTEPTPARLYKIGHATSQDGIAWQKDGKQLIESRLNPDECQALPTVIHFNDRYHMFFCYREATDFRKNSSRAYRLGYAHSDDLIQWTRADDQVGIDVTPGDWDAEMQCYPHVFQCDDNIYLLYNGNEFGRYGFGLAMLEGRHTE